MAEIIVWISITLMFGTIGYVIGRDLYKNLIRPFLCYKFVIFDMDDEYTFFAKKKHAIVREGVKGFELFRKKKGDDKDGEFYTLPLDKAYNDVNDKYSKRDDRGYVTYYYYRNNNTPIHIVPDKEISMVVNDARATTKILKTNIFDSSINMEPAKNSSLSWVMVVIIIVAVLIIILFQDKLVGLIG